ncbi:PIG-L family deacetylase [Flavobacterium crassostreae]|uniref:LmbE family protein n=1 Tax=Flavobacterium crassostreae TaxID=1763534 RepID=A0A1B9E2I2_9FLAO|nr:PIG-L family deacetylase [Flavobacterium crassostreae]OCB76137.1 LmbE family protein [Flavobacterium crassostreae]
MPQNNLKYLLILVLFSGILTAQKPLKPNAVSIYNQIQKLNFLGSVLYIAAHPDDENTRLISYFANQTKAQTAYLSLTRGDGGQNLIGAQLRESLGVIRTQELLEARKIDGGEQYFSRANDFGYSKNPTETLAIWNQQQVTADVVWAIRKFQPDIIINRFDHRTPGTTHGHHTSSAILSTQGFALAKDPTAYPEQLQFVSPWQTKRQFFNTSWWFYGSHEKFAAADKTNMTAIQTGVYYANLGKSNQEIAACSRSSHQSQGFGTTGSRGEDTEYLELINGTPAKDKNSIFEGINTRWDRVKGGKPIGALLTKIIGRYDFNNPAASIPDLLKIYKKIQDLEDTHWKAIKTKELKTILAGCSGLYLEAVSLTPEANPGSLISLQLEAINRSKTTLKLLSVTSQPDNKTTPINAALSFNKDTIIPLNLQLPPTLDYTQPYWLKEKATVGMYVVSDQKKIGVPDIIREVTVLFNIQINNTIIPFERTVVYKYNDNVKGEKYQYLDIVPEVTTSMVDKVSLFCNNQSKSVAVKIKAGRDSIQGNLTLDLPKDWTVTPAAIAFELLKKGAEQTAHFMVTPPSQPTEVYAKSSVTIGTQKYSKEQITIAYEHIAKQQLLPDAEAKFIRLDLKINQQKIAYIMGAGDEVPQSLTQMGYAVSLLTPEEISPEKLTAFDVVITGIRAYNTLPELATKQSILLDFVQSGKNMLVQYNTPTAIDLAPYPLHISRDRVTDETAEVHFLAPNHPVLNYPNKITAQDFKGWKQEQGLYYPDQFDASYTAIVSSADPGESPKKGALLIAPYGKGYYSYTGLSFFRELPEGVSGAYRLLANIISLKNPATNPTQEPKKTNHEATKN